MKILKYILLGLVVLAILFFAFGLFKPTVSYGHEITTNKPLKEAWAVTQDANKYDQWLKGFKSMELLEGEYMQAGSKYKVIVNPGEGQPDFEMIETVMDVKEFELVNLHFDSEFMNFEQKILFSGDENSSTVKTESKVLAKGLVSKSMFAIMETLGGTFTIQEVENIENLKKVIEGNTTVYYPAPVEAVEAASMVAEEVQ